MKIYGLFIVIFFAFGVSAQSLQRDFPLSANGSVDIVNLYGRVEISSDEAEKTDEPDAPREIGRAFLTAENARDADLKIVSENNRLAIVVQPPDPKSRVNLILKIPPGMRVQVETGAGEIRLSGNIASAVAKTETGTIAANILLENLKYNFVWTESRPRFLSDVELKKVKEKAGGKFVVSGRIVGEEGEKEKGEKEIEETSEATETNDEEQSKNNEKSKSKNQKSKTKDLRPKPVNLEFTTARGIILLNVPLNEISPDLRERPLTDAAKAIVRSGDGGLTEAIRRASPKYFGDYAKTLPPLKREPVLRQAETRANSANARIKRVLVSVTDLNNRAIAGLKIKDFEVSESGEKREIVAVEPATAPFNLVLLLDVSGSVDDYVDFIRKAARQFVETADRNDKIAIIIFNEDVKTLSAFTSNKGKLSESLDTFDAGGGTAFYDALGYTLTETLRPLKGERTAIVALTDGDDNRSFLPFDSLLGSIQESGALVYPMYVPSGLIAASTINGAVSAIDPLRAKYMSLTTKASGEGEKLARISGGVYYPISQLSQIQKAYEDIVVQLRTAYSVTFRSDLAEMRDGRASPRLKIKINRENAFVKLGSVVVVPTKESSKLKQDNFPPNSSRKDKELNKSGYFTTAQNSFANFAPLRETSFQKTSFANRQTSAITGEVERINYKQSVNDNLREYKLEKFDINAATGAFLLNNDKEKIAVSRWISPKRTRSYPYERVYDTLANPKRVTVIPVLKDEGLGGERDFLQWDTISLMSLLNVHVVPAYYKDATKNLKRNDQITGQKLDNEYVTARLNEIFTFKGTALEWNERESKNLKIVFEKARNSYREISKTTKTYLHDESSLNALIKLAENPNAFAEFSRAKSQRGQSRELKSIQPKEALSTDTKGAVTITNFAGGKYYFTCDETLLEGKTLFLIEAKHSRRAVLPSENDIKDGLLKMIIYTNLKNVRVGKIPVTEKAVIRLTSSKLVGSLDSDVSEETAAKIFQTNSLSVSQTNFIKKLFEEARANKFKIILEHAETAAAK
ncbi:MAG TPA: VWA domain-containing protein [Pyrinomonadaceae bacterium]|nr:VWA domain-containing protein [Pyrinomonadaceae bacterium]